MVRTHRPEETSEDREGADELVEAIAHLFFPENAAGRERVRELVRERDESERWLRQKTERRA